MLSSSDFVHKLAAWVLSPLGTFFLLVIWARSLRTLELSRLARWAASAAFVGFWIFGCGVTTRFVGVPLEDESAVLPEPGSYDAVVLLGGGMGFHADCRRPEMFSSADRVWTAAKLWRPGLPLTVSGGDAVASTVPLLSDLGVDAKCVHAFEAAKNTEDEARMIRALGVHRIALVTSAWHMPRARTLFERQGFEVLPCPTDFEMHCKAEAPLRAGDFFPDADSLRLNSYAVKEWVARACYGCKRR